MAHAREIEAANQRTPEPPARLLRHPVTDPSLSSAPEPPCLPPPPKRPRRASVSLYPPTRLPRPPRSPSFSSAARPDSGTDSRTMDAILRL
eukprot:2633107-Pyramimonas_sp.AAC.1